MKLYDYGNSSAAYRVRIAMNLKGIAYDRTTISLVKDGGQQHAASYKAVNPQELVPTLDVDGHMIGQSLAIVEYLDETHPQPRLLPGYPAERARVRQIAYAIACDIHPVNNLRMRQYLSGPLNADKAQVDTWYAHWITLGFTAVEQLLASSKDTGTFCHGEAPTLADICLVPQMANAYRFKVPVDRFPTMVRIDKTCRELKAFADAAPENFPDA